MYYEPLARNLTYPESNRLLFSNNMTNLFASLAPFVFIFTFNYVNPINIITRFRLHNIFTFIDDFRLG